MNRLCLLVVMVLFLLQPAFADDSSTPAGSLLASSEPFIPDLSPDTISAGNAPTRYAAIRLLEGVQGIRLGQLRLGTTRYLKNRLKVGDLDCTRIACADYYLLIDGSSEIVGFLRGRDISLTTKNYRAAGLIQADALSQLLPSPEANPAAAASRSLKTEAGSPDAPLYQAVVRGDADGIRQAVEKGAKLSAIDRASGLTPLGFAAREGRLDTVALLLLLGAPPDDRDNAGMTPLMHACATRKLPVVVALIEAGADVNAVDPQGRTVLSFAKESGDQAILSAVKASGASESTGTSRALAEDAGKYFKVLVHYGTNRKPMMKGPTLSGFTSDLADAVSYGTCTVSIPKGHVPGEMEAPRWYLLEFSADPQKHVTLLEVTAQSQEEYLKLLKERLLKADENEILLFVHGFNVSFEDAAKRTAQLAFDLDFKGIPLFYSWPSSGSVTKYKDDQQRVEASIPHLQQFLKSIATTFRGTRVNIIAHSMGTYGLTRALTMATSEMGDDDGTRFNQLILAAPDIDRKVFNEEIAPKLKSRAERVTLYASSNDLALHISRLVNKKDRAGDIDPAIVTNRWVESVDVSKVDAGLIGHSYYGDSKTVITDIRMVLARARPEQRTFLEPKDRGAALRYWYFNPDLLPAGRVLGK